MPLLLLLLSTPASATCSEGRSSLQLAGPPGTAACLAFGAGAELAVGAELRVSAWYELCCHGEGQTTDFSPCSIESYEPHELRVLGAGGEVVAGAFEPTGEQCGGTPVVRFTASLAPGRYQVTTPDGAYALTVLPGAVVEPPGEKAPPRQEAPTAPATP